MIPPTKNIGTGETQVLRVAAYCRVSTLEETQAGSFELQCQHYREYIKENPKWEFVDIFSDEGVSGTSMTKRIGFMNMIDACIKVKPFVLICFRHSTQTNGLFIFLNINQIYHPLHPLSVF